MGGQWKDLVGQQFGRLTVVGKAEKSNKHGHRRWRCQCSCGGESTVDTPCLKRGHTQSCGCLAIERARKFGQSALRHGQCTSGIYMTWSGMRQRCNYRNGPHYSDYGGRGIRVCARWASFEAFAEDMGPRPDGTSIDRIDNDGNYEPGNCQWATPHQQASNKRNNHHITAGGLTLTVAEWTRRLGGSIACVFARLHRGWSEEDAVLTPIGKTKRKH